MFRELLRKNQKLSSDDCIALLKNETRGVLSVLGEHGYPYGTPMNHWYNEEDGCIYFHCGKAGHRLDALTQNNKVSFCVYNQGKRQDGQWAWRVNSVIVFGTVTILDDFDTIADITRKLSYKFTQDEKYIESEIQSSAHKTLLLRLTPEHICGKQVVEA